MAKKNKQSSKFLLLLKFILVIAIIAGLGFVYIKFFYGDKGLKITTWNNKYNENNIRFTYQESVPQSIKNLDSIYKISTQITANSSEISKALQAETFLKSIADIDNTVEETTKNNGYDIIKDMGGRKKLSERDMAIVQRDILIDLGFKVRIGELKKESPQFQKKPDYYVIEYWSKNYNKWVMLDFKDLGYFEKDDIPQSAMEVLDSKLDDLTYIGKSAQKTYKAQIQPYLQSYTVAIDNTLEQNNSKINLTYCTTKKNLDLKVGNKFIGPTLFTDNRVLFDKSPDDKVTSTDYKAYIVLTKKKDDNQDYTYTINAYKDNALINDFYIKINDDPVERISSGKDVTFDKGTYSIGLMLDGVNVVNNIVIVRDK